MTLPALQVLALSPRVHLIAREFPAGSHVAEFLHELAVVVGAASVAGIVFQPLPKHKIQRFLLLHSAHPRFFNQVGIRTEGNVLQYDFSVHEPRAVLLRQELLRLPQKNLQLIMMHPVPRVVHLHHAVILDDVRLSAGFGVRRPALPPPEQ